MSNLSMAFVVNGILGIVTVVVVIVAFEVRKRRLVFILDEAQWAASSLPAPRVNS
jgi:hypothetical protein